MVFKFITVINLLYLFMNTNKPLHQLHPYSNSITNYSLTSNTFKSPSQNLILLHYQVHQLLHQLILLFQSILKFVRPHILFIIKVYV